VGLGPLKACPELGCGRAMCRRLPSTSHRRWSATSTAWRDLTEGGHGTGLDRNGGSRRGGTPNLSACGTTHHPALRNGVVHGQCGDDHQAGRGAEEGDHIDNPYIGAPIVKRRVRPAISSSLSSPASNRRPRDAYVHSNAKARRLPRQPELLGSFCAPAGASANDHRSGRVYDVSTGLIHTIVPAAPMHTTP